MSKPWVKISLKIQMFLLITCCCWRLLTTLRGEFGGESPDGGGGWSGGGGKMSDQFGIYVCPRLPGADRPLLLPVAVLFCRPVAASVGLTLLSRYFEFENDSPPELEVVLCDKKSCCDGSFWGSAINVLPFCKRAKKISKLWTKNYQACHMCDRLSRWIT